MWEQLIHGFTNQRFRFDAPIYLALLALLPLIVFAARRSLAGLGPVRQRLAISLRCLVLVCFVLALAGLERVRTVDNQTVVFALDRSFSVPAPQRQEAFEFVRRAAEGARRGKDHAAVVAFDGVAAVEQLGAPRLELDRLGAAQRGDWTDIAAALRLSATLFPGDAARRVVLLSDGNENAGDAAEEAERYKAAGIPVDVVPLRFEHQNEVVFERLASPPTAALEETINLNLILRSQRPMTGRIRLYHNDALLNIGRPANGPNGGADYPVALDQGPNRITVPVPLRTAGVHRFRAVFEPDNVQNDTIPANNEARAFTIVAGEPKALLITQGGNDPNAAADPLLAQALASQKIACEIRRIGEVVLDPPALLEYSLVILSNISALSLTEAEQQSLASYVRDLGGGLVVIGGDAAFSVGGYYKTPLEEVLPVETNRQKLQLLSLAMVLVIDKSGSMSGEKLESAKAAALAAVELLTPHDQIGVVAFDERPVWTNPLGLCLNRMAIGVRISSIGEGGGTNLAPAMEEAADALMRAEAGSKHVVILTDGQSQPGDFDSIAERMAAAGITISTVAVGNEADQALLARIAKIGRGRFYATDRARPLPQIFVRETVLASRSGMSEQPFKPQVQKFPPSPLVAGLVPAEIPRLGGYVVTAAKPTALVPLVRKGEKEDDPILAHWQVGLGKTVAFTSGMWSRWGAEWVAWPGFSKLWAQLCRWAARPADSAAFNTAIQIDGGTARLRIEANNRNGAWMNGLRFDGRIVNPSFQAAPLTAVQTGPGIYEASFPATEAGNYVVQLRYGGAGPEAVTGLLQTGIAVACTPEFRESRSNEAFLTEIARRTGGRVIAPAHPEAVFESWSIRPVQSRQAAWEDLVRLALLLFLLDVAVRRIAVDPLEAARAVRRFIAELAGVPATAGGATVTTLKDAREKVRQSIPVRGPRAKSPSAAPKTSQNAGTTRSLGRVTDQPPGKTADQDSAQVNRSDSAPPEARSGDYMARLRQAKKRANPNEDGSDENPSARR